MKLLILLLGLSVIFVAAWGQEADRLSFEVASVKPSPPDARSNFGRDPGRLTATAVSLRILIEMAYSIDDDQFSGPGWMDEARFDVVAKVPSSSTREQVSTMLQNLLAERFQLQVHHESRMVPVYELVVAKNGPKLKLLEKGPGTDDFVPGRGRIPMDRNGFPILPPGRPNYAGHYGPGGAHLAFRMQTMQFLARNLSHGLGADRRVVDKTGLTDRYDFTLFYRPANGPRADSDDDAPSLEQAIQEQLGLKLVPSKTSLDVLVIDHAEKVPTEN